MQPEPPKGTLSLDTASDHSVDTLDEVMPRSKDETAGLQLEVALYVENISSELRLMARRADLETLAYFLEMVRIEASLQVENHARSS